MKRKISVTAYAIFLFLSCSENKNEYAWQYSNGDLVPIVLNSYSFKDSIIKQKIQYESSWEYFEIDLHKMVGKYSAKNVFYEDSLLDVSLVVKSSFSEPIYRLGLGYSDLTYDNEIDFYLEPEGGIFLAINPNNQLGNRTMVKVHKDTVIQHALAQQVLQNQ